MRSPQDIPNAPDDWIGIHEMNPWTAIRKYDLEAGGTEVISLALAREHDEVLVDEESVRDVALLYDGRPRGTLYLETIRKARQLAAE